MGPLLGLSSKTLTQIANFKTAKLKKGVMYHKASPQGKRPYRPLRTELTETCFFEGTGEDTSFTFLSPKTTIISMN